jgi:predicted amidophosphoribosyltransferase
MRLQQIDPREFSWLDHDDKCWYFGEYTAGGGYGASATNNSISNLKKPPNSSPAVLVHKHRAINIWGDVLRELVPPNKTAGVVTFVPMPGSKPRGHPEYDDRMLRVLQRMASGHAGVDIRPMLAQTVERDPQHHGGGRKTPEELAASLELVPAEVAAPCQRILIVVDDVITMGASFAAAKRILAQVPGVTSIRGIFLAKTVHPVPDFDIF